MSSPNGTIGASAPAGDRECDDNQIDLVKAVVDSTQLSRADANRAVARAATLGGDYFSREIGETAAQNFRHRQDLARSKHKVRLSCIGDTASLAVLAEAFPMFELICGNDRDDLGHPVARAARKLDYELIFRVHLQLNSEFRLDIAPSGHKYDVVVKDVGGDQRPVLEGGLTSVHTCRPILDSADVCRRDNFNHYLENNAARLALTPGVSAAVEDILSGRSRYDCTRPAQYCHVRAPNVVFLHSSYNISLPDLVAILDRAEAQRAFAVLHIHPNIFGSAAGGVLPGLDCRYSKYTTDGVHYIAFSFDNDPQLSYIHRFDTYIALATASHLNSIDGTSRFIVERFRYNRLSTMYIKLTRVTQSVPQHNVINHIPFMDSKNLIFLHTYRYDTVVTGVTGQLLPVIIPVDKGYFNRLVAYASQLTTGKFISSNVEVAAHSMNARTVVGGQTFPTHTPLESLDVIIVAYSVYIIVYVENFHASQTVAHLRNEEDRKRQASSFLRTAAACIHDITRKFFRTATYTVGSIELHISHLEKWLLTHQEEFTSIITTHAPRTLSFYDVIPEFVSHVSQPLMNYCRIPATHEVKTTDLSLFPNMPGGRDCPAKNVECNERLFTRRVPGDGDCFYHSAAAVLDIADTPQMMRNRLLSSVWLPRDEKSRDTVVGRLMSKGVDGWTDQAVVKLFAREYEVAVCVHGADGNCVLYNPNASLCVHMDLTDNHFSPMLATKFVPHPNICQPLRGVHIDKVNVDYNARLAPVRVTKAPAAPSRRAKVVVGALRSDCLAAANNYDPLSQLNGLSYSSNYALLLHAAVHDNPEFGRLFEFSQRVLDVSSTNGSSFEYWSQGMHLNITHVSDSRLRSSLPSDVAVHDIAMLSDLPPPSEFDVVCLNPPFTDGLAEIDVDGYVRRFDKHVKALDYLAQGGHLIIGVPFTTDPRVLSRLSALFSRFQDCFISYCRRVPPHNPWMLFVARFFDTAPRTFSDADVSSAIARVWSSHLPALRHAISKIQAVASRRSSAEPLSHHDYKTIMRDFRPRCSSVGGGTQPQLDAPEWVPRFNTRVFERYDLTSAVVDDTAAFRSFIRLFSRDASRVIVEHFSKVLGLPPLDPTNVWDYDRGFARSPLAANGFFVSFMNQLVVNVVEKNMISVVFTLDARDLLSDTRLSTANFATPDLLARVVALRKTAPIVQPKRVTALPLLADAIDAMRAREKGEERDVHRVTALLPPPPAVKRTSMADMTISELFPVVEGGVATLYPTVRNRPDWQKTVIDEFHRYNTRAVEDVEALCRRYVRMLVDTPDRLRSITGAEDPCVVIGAKRLCGRLTHVINGERKTYYRYAAIWDDFKPKSLRIVPVSAILDGTVSKRNIFTFDKLKIFSEFDFARKLLPEQYVTVDTSRVGIIQAAAGCGKTTAIIKLAGNFADAVDDIAILTSTREGALDVAERMRAKYGKSSKLATRVCTIDSYLMNKKWTSKYLLVDEALMQIPGKLLWACSVSGCVGARFYGDRLQIPFINRLPSVELFMPEAAKVFPVASVYDLSYRCPADVAFVLYNLYLSCNSADGINLGMRSASSASTPSMFRVSIRSIRDIPRNTDATYLVYTQSEKEALIDSGIPCHTVHEFQGKESDHINVVRLTRDEGDTIFTSKVNHSVTIITRHRKTLHYYSLGPANDLLSTWIERARHANSRDLDTVRVVDARQRVTADA